MRYTFKVGGRIVALDLEKKGEGYQAVIEGQTYAIQLLRSESGEVSFRLGDHTYTAHTAADGPRRWVMLAGRNWMLDSGMSAGRERGRESLGHGVGGDRLVVAPMPGQVRAVQVKVGDQVEKGATLLLLEAMKMEIRIQAPRSGQVARVLVRPGQTVERDQVLAEMD